MPRRVYILTKVLTITDFSVICFERIHTGEERFAPVLAFSPLFLQSALSWISSNAAVGNGNAFCLVNFLGTAFY